MKRTALLLTFLFGVALVVPGVARAHAHAQAVKAFPITIVDDLGNHIRLDQMPKHLLSLDPRDTETLFALGLENRVVGDGSKQYEGAAGISRNFRYPSEWPSPWGRDYPVRAKQLPHIEGGCCGTPWNLETVVSLQPDLVLTLNSDLTTIRKMRDLGLKVIVLDPANAQGIMHDVALVGKATGSSKQATTVIRNIKKQVDSVRAALSRARSHPRTYYEIDATNPIQPYVAGPGTYIDEGIHIAGGVNVAANVTYPGCPGKNCYPPLALEALVKLDPQIIVLGDAAYGTTVSSVKSRSGWSTMSAVQSGKIYPFNDELITRAGPRIAIGIQKLAARIHPEAFRIAHA